MIDLDIDSTSPLSRIPPFRGRQRTSDSPLPRYDPRAAKFYGIRSRLPPLTSPAACARYRLGRKNAAAAARLDIQLNRIATLLDALLALPHTLAAVIHTPSCASSPSCDPVPSARFLLPPRTPSPRTPPFPHSLTAPPLSYVPPSTSHNFSVDDCITRSPDTTQSRDLHDGERSGYEVRRDKWRENHINTPYDPPW
ncbi:hypothetical protein C8R47DRAFT_1221012 [Mycena vitilis]|nr:hypothetical protein C8R47DRAFT_1221012 [Mycena vitilis]